MYMPSPSGYPVPAWRRKASAYQQIKVVVAQRHPALADPEAVSRLQAFAGQLLEQERPSGLC
jgi:hypothetical protein